MQSLITSMGLIDNLSVFFINIRTSLDDENEISDLIQNSLHFLTSITKFLIPK